jgi:hypothetical protein
MASLPAAAATFDVTGEASPGNAATIGFSYAAGSSTGGAVSVAIANTSEADNSPHAVGFFFNVPDEVSQLLSFDVTGDWPSLWVPYFYKNGIDKPEEIDPDVGAFDIGAVDWFVAFSSLSDYAGIAPGQSATFSFGLGGTGLDGITEDAFLQENSTGADDDAASFAVWFQYEQEITLYGFWGHGGDYYNCGKWKSHSYGFRPAGDPATVHAAAPARGTLTYASYAAGAAGFRPTDAVLTLGPGAVGQALEGRARRGGYTDGLFVYGNYRGWTNPFAGSDGATGRLQLVGGSHGYDGKKKDCDLPKLPKLLDDLALHRVSPTVVPLPPALVLLATAVAGIGACAGFSRRRD